MRRADKSNKSKLKPSKVSLPKELEQVGHYSLIEENDFSRDSEDINSTKKDLFDYDDNKHEYLKDKNNR